MNLPSSQSQFDIPTPLARKIKYLEDTQTEKKEIQSLSMSGGNIYLVDTAVVEHMTSKKRKISNQYCSTF